MAGKKTKTTTETVAAAPVEAAAVAAVAAAPKEKKAPKQKVPKEKTAAAPKEKKEKAPREKKEKAPRAKKAATEATAESGVEEKKGDAVIVPKSRVAPTHETVQQEFDNVMNVINTEISALRSVPSKVKGVKFLRSLNKSLANLRSHALRALKVRPASKRSNTNSGFLKPVQISKDLAKFTGWDMTVPRSRVDVTKFICKYIEEHKLQNPTDRRQIRVDDDPKLKALLRIDGADKTPLTYYSLQSHLKNHFTALPNAAAATPAAAPAQSASATSDAVKSPAAKKVAAK
jgi:chromatin remodeling complex protein RSC6